MKKAIKTKKITIDTLAVLMKDGFDGVGKKFNYTEDLIDKLAVSTSKGFESIDKKLDQHDKIFELMIKDLKTIHEDNKYFRQTVSILNSNDLFYDRKIEDLTTRVEKLELNAR